MNIPEPPDRLKHLPRDHRGYVVPFFVCFVNGVPDFRVIDGRQLVRCVKEALCWLCGGKLGRYSVYVIGPMCAINRTSSEPPSHRECAEYAARVCPFLTMPKAVRREANLPEGRRAPAGEMLKRNPGVTLLWVTRDRLNPFGDGRGGVLFHIGKPDEVLWFSEGRTATRAEVLASIDSGLPALLEVAKQDREGAIAELAKRRLDVEALLPA